MLNIIKLSIIKKAFKKEILIAKNMWKYELNNDRFLF